MIFVLRRSFQLGADDKRLLESPVTKRGTEKTTFVSPESSSFKRSRSGRLLLPTLEFWRNQLVIYDGDHQITGIQEGPRDVEPSRGLFPKNIYFKREIKDFDWAS
ncbi:hypothetical protein RHGRI_015206 [Rhododendron griersonianum]|uniref:Uncharacterized protein n=1 Tax=Rhododendron griersonianum TaxID=479676 RepID=A0AAV6KD11_9ERIC|nr:hypothetical protein RHGRI_015206 [Rhododendron griersonianum]